MTTNQEMQTMLKAYSIFRERSEAVDALQKNGFCLFRPPEHRSLFHVRASDALGERRFALSTATKMILAHEAPKDESHCEPESGFAWSAGKEAYHFTPANSRKRGNLAGGFHPCINERVEFADKIFQDVNALLSIERHRSFPDRDAGIAWSAAVSQSYHHVMSFFRYHGSNPNNLHADAHVDKGVFTICENPNDLEVFVRGKWISLDGQEEGVVAVLVGYSLERATGGIFQAVRHRVRNTGDRRALVTKIRFDPGLVIYPPSIIANAPEPLKTMIPDPTDEISVKDMIEAFNNTHRSVNSSPIAHRPMLSETRKNLNVTGHMGRFSDLPTDLVFIALSWLWGDIRDSFRISATCRSLRAIAGSEEHIVPAAEHAGFRWDQNFLSSIEWNQIRIGLLPRPGYWLKYLGRTLYHKMQPLDIRIKDGTGEEITFRVNPTVYMGKMFLAFCQRIGTSRATIRFLLDGERVDDFQTPYNLQLEDNVQIDAVLNLRGD